MKILLFPVFVLFLWGCAPPRGGLYHTVEKGQTLYRISQAYGVDERYLARLNGIADPTRLEAGQLVYIPSATRPVAVSTSSGSPSPPRPAPPASSPPSRPAPAPKPRSVADTSKRPLPPAPPPKALPPATLSPRGTSSPSPFPSAAVPDRRPARGKFDWPVPARRLLRNFGSNGLLSCQGIEIAVPAGTPVLSSDSGTVTYSGEGIRGYGNLIILRHDDAYFTVYAYNRKNLVAAGKRVEKGETIALSGTRPSGGEPCLHFEVRRGKTAVNPIFYLP